MFGRHNFKMGVPAKTGGGFGCLWCRKAMPRTFTQHRKSWSATNAPTSGQKRTESGTTLTGADEKATPQEATSSTCGHAHLSTIARLIDMGVGCPECKVSTGIPYVEGYQGKQGTQG